MTVGRLARTLIEAIYFIHDPRGTRADAHPATILGWNRSSVVGCQQWFVTVIGHTDENIT